MRCGLGQFHKPSPEFLKFAKEYGATDILLNQNSDKDNHLLDHNNRWELKVYEKGGYNSSEEWDGKSNIGGVVVGTGELPEGTYYYIIEPNENGSSGSKSVKGYVYIRRWNK